jgi:hypothetical protein
MNELWGFVPKSPEEVPHVISAKAPFQRFELPAAESVVVYYSYYYKIFSFRSDQDNRPLQSLTVEHALPRDIHVEESWSPAFEKWLSTGNAILAVLITMSLLEELAGPGVSTSPLLQAVLSSDSPDFKPGSELQIK